MIDRRQFVGAALAASLPGRVLAANEPAPARRLEARPTVLDLGHPQPTPVLGYEGVVPGPVLTVRKGEPLRVRLVNSLDQPTSLHWIGVRVPNAMDGAAPLTQGSVAPGGSMDYAFTPPDAGTFGYRAAGPLAAQQVARGLAGLLIVTEPEPPLVDHDWPLVLANWAVGPTGLLDGTSAPVRLDGSTEPRLTVNGRLKPDAIELLPAARVRLRLFNACVARLCVVALEGARPLVIAVDGQPCDLFEPLRQAVPLGPGGRVDILLDLPGDEGAAVRIVLRGGEALGGPDRVLATVTARGLRRAALPPIAALPTNPALPRIVRLEDAKRMDFTIGGGERAGSAWTLNGVAGPPSKPAFSVAPGRPVSLGFINKTPVVQGIHVHGHVVRLLHNLDDGWEPYWRDTVLVAPGKTARIAFVADNPGRWLIESAMLDRSGLATWFQVGS